METGFSKFLQDSHPFISIPCYMFSVGFERKGHLLISLQAICFGWHAPVDLVPCRALYWLDIFGGSLSTYICFSLHSGGSIVQCFECASLTWHHLNYFWMLIIKLVQAECMRLFTFLPEGGFEICIGSYSNKKPESSRTCGVKFYPIHESSSVVFALSTTPKTKGCLCVFWQDVHRE